MQWTTPWGSGTGITFTTGMIPVSEDHRHFEVSVAATFRLGSESSTDSKTRSQIILAFDKTGHDELDSVARGKSSAGTFNPPNWFDNRPKHWAKVIARFNEKDSNGNYIVHYAPRFEEAYRGRIYIFAEIIIFNDSYSVSSGYGPFTGGIDKVANAVAHEFTHRDQWLDPQNWGGFSSAQIGGPPPNPWYPGTPLTQADFDGDLVKTDYERAHEKDFHFQEALPRSILWWWRGAEVFGPNDYEMYAQLWGEWPTFSIGSLDPLDWSAGGRRDY